MSEGTVRVIDISEDKQLRLSISDFRGKRSLDIREYYRFANEAEFKPTKRGTQVPSFAIDSLLDAVNELRGGLVDAVTKLSDDTRYIIAADQEAAKFHKKKVYATADEAKSKTPPDGYRLYRALIKNGTVVSVTRIASFKSGKWKDVTKTAD